MPAAGLPLFYNHKLPSPTKTDKRDLARLQFGSDIASAFAGGEDQRSFVNNPHGAQQTAAISAGLLGLGGLPAALAHDTSPWKKRATPGNADNLFNNELNQPAGQTSQVVPVERKSISKGSDSAVSELSAAVKSLQAGLKVVIDASFINDLQTAVMNGTAQGYRQ